MHVFHNKKIIKPVSLWSPLTSSLKQHQTTATVPLLADPRTPQLPLSRVPQTLQDSGRGLRGCRQIPTGATARAGPLEEHLECQGCSAFVLPDASRTHFYSYRTTPPQISPPGPPGVSTPRMKGASRTVSQASSPAQGHASHPAQKSPFCSDNLLTHQTQINGDIKQTLQRDGLMLWTTFFPTFAHLAAWVCI